MIDETVIAFATLKSADINQESTYTERYNKSCVNITPPTNFACKWLQ